MMKLTLLATALLSASGPFVVAAGRENSIYDALSPAEHGVPASQGRVLYVTNVASY